MPAPTCAGEVLQVFALVGEFDGRAAQKAKNSLGALADFIWYYLVVHISKSASGSQRCEQSCNPARHFRCDLDFQFQRVAKRSGRQVEFALAVDGERARFTGTLVASDPLAEGSGKAQVLELVSERAG